MRLIALAAVTAMVATAAVAQTPPSAEIKNNAGAAVGSATFREGPKGVLVQVKVSGLTPGWHGIHFHAVGDCSDTAKFQKSGAHINHAGDHKMPHGLLNPAGSDFGELPNIFAGADGVAEAQLWTSLVSWSGKDGRPGLADADGSALVIHANQDDHLSQPIGGAGDRVACAVIK
ncbi:superoxide dismutase family protein [Caulobacter sp. NIBR2454]|uniref:superoxide dismutase family protein n=1 Tax=Caulobacter sp. NIBR2454 TaxID=3015996 RepID=UPI0022B6EF96|nr:superoxide dismutase family protein [Caulobacter sp. NIBR2454]